MSKKNLYFDLIDKERNVYQLAHLYPQKRKKIEEYLDLLQDPISKKPLTIENGQLIGEKSYSTKDNIANFNTNDKTSLEWRKLNNQFLNYHKSLTVYTMLNASPINNYVSQESGIGDIKDLKVLDVGGGTGHAFNTFFNYPESIDYYLLDPNLRLLHDQFIRLYPKLNRLKMGHIIANAEYLPIKDEVFDVVINLSAIDHFDDYKKFIGEAYRVLKKGGKFLVTSHLDVAKSQEDATKSSTKLFSFSFFERLSRYLFYKKHFVGQDDHTLHLTDEKPIEKTLLDSGFKIVKSEVFKRHFYFVAVK